MRDGGDPALLPYPRAGGGRCEPDHPGAADHPQPRGGRAAGDVLRAVLRPRLRLRGHPAVAPSGRGPQLVGRCRDGLHARSAVLGVELHDVDDELVRPGHGAGPARAGVRDAREPADGGRDPGGIRRVCAAVRVRLLGPADRAQRVRRRGHAARSVQPELSPDTCLERAVGPAVGGGRRRRLRRMAVGAVAGCSRARPRRAAGHLLAAGRGHHADEPVADRGRPFRRALPAVRDHRARRERRARGRDRLRHRAERRSRRRAPPRLPVVDGALVAVLRPGGGHGAGPDPRGHAPTSAARSAATSTRICTYRSSPGSCSWRSATRS